MTINTTYNLRRTNYNTPSTPATPTTPAYDASAPSGSAQNPFILQNGSNWVTWTAGNKPQYISYQNNLYKFGSTSGNTLLYTAVQKLPTGQNNLRINFTGSAKDEITGYTTERVQVGTQSIQVGTQSVQIGTERVQTGTEQYQTGTQRVQTGTQSVQTGTERYQTGTEQIQTGTQRIQTGTQISGYNTRVVTGTINVNRELDGRDNVGAVGNILNAENGTGLLLDATKANSFFTTEAAKYKVSSLLGEDNQSASKTVDIFSKTNADDMYVAGDPQVGGKGNNYNADTITPNTGFVTMFEDGLDTGRKTTINAHVDQINSQGNRAFTEYGFVIQDDTGAKTNATLSGGQLLIDGQPLLPGQQKIIGDPNDPVAKFYYASMPGGANGTNEQRLVFESYEKATPETRQKLIAAGADPTQVDALRSKTQTTFGFRIPDGNGSYRSSAGVAGGLPVTSNGVKTYYDAHFSEPDSFTLPTRKEYQDPVYGPVYTDKPVYGSQPTYGERPVYTNQPVYADQPTYGTRPVYTDRPKYQDQPIYSQVPVYENRQKPVYGKKYEISKTLSSPLVLDLDGDGIETTPQNKVIDLDGDGQLDQASWFGSKEGVLTFDANHNGKIDLNGKELFGDSSDVNGDGSPDHFANGFEALRALATKTLGAAAVQDNMLDASEIKALENKAGLRMMVGNKTVKLSDNGISNLSLNYQNSTQTDAYGNEFRQQASFQKTLSNGQVVNRDMTDVWLNYSPLTQAQPTTPATTNWSSQLSMLQSLFSHFFNR
jgi:hypothetical protein